MVDDNARIGGAARQGSDAVPWTMVLAIVCGAMIATLWTLVALLLVGIVMSTSSVLAVLLCVLGVLAASLSIAGVVGCFRRWIWVRWAAALQAIAVPLALCTWVPWLWFVPAVIVLVIVYAVLQFLPQSHRWLYPKPRR